MHTPKIRFFVIFDTKFCDEEDTTLESRIRNDNGTFMVKI